MVRSRLSARTLEVLELLAQGMTNKEIAAQMRLSEPTVKWHVSKLLAEYDIPNRAALVREAFKRGDLEVERVPKEDFSHN